MQRAVECIVSHTRDTPHKALLLTGAGISTAWPTNVPDYRSPTTGLYNRGHRPITYQQFIATTHQQRRYFARSFVGYRRMHAAATNVVHTAIARMLQDGRWIGRCVTQNVDGLTHHAMLARPATASEPCPPRMVKSDAAANAWITELHGSIHYVVCMRCGEREHRFHLQERMAAANADWLRRIDPVKLVDQDENTEPGKADAAAGANSGGSGAQRVRPDGDFQLTDEEIAGFDLPVCLACSGALQPAVVLFGDSIPAETKRRAQAWMQESPVLVCAGTSLQVPSAFTFVREAMKLRRPVVIFNDGPTRVDEEKPGAIDPALVLRVPGRLECTIPQLALSLP
jgi:NAD-dependent SIR2 family protein deacetylase